MYNFNFSPSWLPAKVAHIRGISQEAAAAMIRKEITAYQDTTYEPSAVDAVLARLGLHDDDFFELASVIYQCKPLGILVPVDDKEQLTA